LARFKDFLTGLLAAVGLLFLPFLLLGLAAVLFFPRGAPGLPDSFYLTVDLRGGLPEAPPPDPLVWLQETRPLSLDQAVLALDAARADPRVKGVLARVGGEAGGPARVEELRAAIARFREGGGFAHAFSDSFGEFGPGNWGYYLASAFERITLQPSGAVGLTGVWVEVPLLRGLLDEIGVIPRLESREAYKTFKDTFTARELTPEHRRSLESLTDDLSRQLVDGIAAARGLEPAQVRVAIDTAPLLADQAEARGLVDRIAYLDEAEAAADAAAGTDDTVPLAVYAARAQAEMPGDGPAVALVNAIGPIIAGEGSPGGVGGFTIGADSLSAALRAAADDPDIKSVVLRVDSPGGSAVASDTIGREVRRLQEAGKPVLVAMGDVAASGGYWIAMDAETIHARPGTLTGSIGVVAGKPVIAPLLENIEVNVPGLGVGANADMWSLTRDYDALGEAKLDMFLDATYAQFVEGVARGRGLAPDKVREVAGGRVWTGDQARERGLVDATDGLAGALAEARERAGIPADGPLRIKRLPEPADPLRIALDYLNVKVWRAMMARVVGAPGPATASVPGVR
jgi:protease-4